AEGGNPVTATCNNYTLPVHPDKHHLSIRELTLVARRPFQALDLSLPKPSGIGIAAIDANLIVNYKRATEPSGNCQRYDSDGAGGNPKTSGRAAGIAPSVGDKDKCRQY